MPHIHVPEFPALLPIQPLLSSPWNIHTFSLLRAGPLSNLNAL